MSYVVGCALRADQPLTYQDTTTGLTYTWAGNLGIAPGWATAPLDQTGQETVSACLLALANPYTHVMVSLRGLSLSTTPKELSGYTLREAGFWGNLFAATPILRGCVGTRNLPTGGHVVPGPRLTPTSTTRTCWEAGTPNGCGIDVDGYCDGECSVPTSEDGHYASCSGSSNVVTTYLSYASVNL
jgi:hypothetical protein